MRARKSAILCRDNKPGATLLFLNTHLDHVSEEARTKGAQLIIEKIAALRHQDESVFVSGDFNRNPGSEAYAMFMDAGYTDTYLSSGNVDDDQTYTFHAFTGSRNSAGHRIDWILSLSGSPGIEVADASITRDLY